jgi:hypothetical protein
MNSMLIPDFLIIVALLANLYINCNCQNIMIFGYINILRF